MSDKLSVGFFAFEPTLHTGAAAQYPAPGSVKFMTIGGPRTRNQVVLEIEACEIALRRLRAELAGLPETQEAKHE